MFGGECLNAQNDNIYIKTSIVNNSFEVGGINAVYTDERIENIVDDACKYELSVYKARIPAGNVPIKIIDPLLFLLDPPSTNWNFMPEQIRVSIGSGPINSQSQYLEWETELKLEYFPASEDPNGIPITEEIYNNKSYFIKYYDYYSLYTLRHFCKILNTAISALHTSIIPLFDNLAGDDVNIPPLFSCDIKGRTIRLHLPPTYIRANNPANIPKIEFNNRLQLLFSTVFPFKYGRLSGSDETKKWNEIDTSILYSEWTTNYDVSSFISPFNSNIYTLNIGGVPILQQFQTFGGFNRIEIYSNIPLVKKEFTQTQNTKTGEIENDFSGQENLLEVIYLNYNNIRENTLYYDAPYPYWKSISNSGSLNNISYSVFLVDNLGNKTPYFLQFGNQINIDLQLRKVF